MAKDNYLDTDEADALAPASPKETWKFLGTMPSKPSWAWWLLTSLAVLAVVAGSLATSTLMGRSVDLLRGGALPIVGSGREAFSLVVIIVAVFVLAESVGRSAANYLILVKARMLSVDLRFAGLRACLKAPVADITRLGSGNIVTRLTRDLDDAVRTTNAVGVRLVVTTVLIPVTVISLIWFHWLFAIGVAAATVAVLVTIRWALKVLPVVSNLRSSAQARRNNRLLDIIRGLPTLRALHLQQWARNRMSDASWFTVRREATFEAFFNRLMLAGSLTYALLLLGTLATAITLGLNDVITPGEATAAVMLVVRLEFSIFNVIFFAGEIQQGLTSLGRAVAVGLLPESQHNDDSAGFTHAPAVDIDDLTFSYPGGESILEDFTLHLSAGSTTALVGLSGAGKSTLAGLIAGLQKPTSGRITVGGQEHFSASDVVLISQEVHLFSGSLRQDLLTAAPDASDDRLIDALAAVGLDSQSTEWLRSFPQGLDTQVGEGAVELAPEVRQQVSLARIFLVNPPVLIMDEATSEAGSDSARVLEEAATTVAQGRTSLVVAHRLDQAVSADRVIVMEAGAIIEDGTHEELLQQHGRYAELYQRWSAGTDRTQQD